MSSIFPFTFPTDIVFAKPIVSVEIPTVKDPDKFTIDVLSPDTSIELLSFNSAKGR